MSNEKNVNRPITLGDIGREAGVSTSIVSRVLRNRKDRIPDSTRKKVMDAAERLGYRRNLLIQGVQTGRTMNIGVIIPSTGSFYSEIVHGIHDELRGRGYCIILAWNPEDIEVPDSSLETELIHQLVDRRVDGIILRPTHAEVSNVYFSEVVDRNIPLVTVDRPLPGVHCDFSGTDDEAGGRLAARCLLEAGHRRLMHLAVKSPFAPALLRQKGFEEECAKVEGVSVSTRYIASYDVNLMQEISQEALAESDRPSGIFVVSDNLVGGVYRAAKAHNLKIPKDLSIVGFGNLPVGEYFDPPLSTIDQSPYEAGRVAARLVLDRIDKTDGVYFNKLLDPVLVERSSVANP